MTAQRMITVVLTAAVGLALWSLGGRSVRGEPAPAVEAAAAATDAQAPPAVDEDARKAAAAAQARAKKHEKVKKLGCFQCHSFDSYLNGRPKPAAAPAAPGGPAEAAAPAGCAAAAAGGDGECRPGQLVAKADDDDEDDDTEAKPAAAGDDAAEGEEKAAKEDEEAEEEEDDAPDPKDFAHGPHEEEGVGHCHQCHAMQGHFQVKVRMEACAACH